MDDRSTGVAGAWVRDGLISFEQAEAIEGGREPWPLHRITEALLYLGASAFTIAVVVWFTDLNAWTRFSPPNHWGAFGVTIAGGSLLAAVAFVLSKDGGGTRRAVGLLLAIAVLHLALAVGAAFQAMEYYGEWASLVNTLIVLSAAAGAWMLRKSVPTEVALFLASASAVTAVIELIQETTFDPVAIDSGVVTGTVAGLFLWLLGGAWLWLGYRRVLTSRNTSYLLGGALAVGAAAGLALGVNRWWVLLLGMTAPLLGAAAIHLRRTILMVPAAAGILAGVLIAIGLWMREPPEIRTWVMIYGIPGLLLIFGALVIADRARRVPPAEASG